jgi:hypothetical protein
MRVMEACRGGRPDLQRRNRSSPRAIQGLVHAIQSRQRARRRTVVQFGLRAKHHRLVRACLPDLRLADHCLLGPQQSAIVGITRQIIDQVKQTTLVPVQPLAVHREGWRRLEATIHHELVIEDAAGAKSGELLSPFSRSVSFEMKRSSSRSALRSLLLFPSNNVVTSCRAKRDQRSIE